MKLYLEIKCKTHPRYAAKGSPRARKDGTTCAVCRALFLAGIGDLNTFDLLRLSAVGSDLRITRE